MQRFKRGDIDASQFTQCRKKVDILAVKVDGPFQVKTIQGMIGCEDGYLIIDDEGNPGLMKKAMFERQYEPIEGEMSVLNNVTQAPEKPAKTEDDFLNDK